MQKNLTIAERLNFNVVLGLKQFELGTAIAKGNNAVVYEARKIEEAEGSFNFYRLVLKLITYYVINSPILLN